MFQSSCKIVENNQYHSIAPTSFEKYESFCHNMGRKWRMRILCLLAYNHTLRYTELKSALTNVTHKVLSAELTQLAEDGMIQRRECGGVPVRVEYTLTAYGRDFINCFSTLAEWIDNNVSDIVPVSA